MEVVKLALENGHTYFVLAQVQQLGFFPCPLKNREARESDCKNSRPGDSNLFFFRAENEEVVFTRLWQNIEFSPLALRALYLSRFISNKEVVEKKTIFGGKLAKFEKSRNQFR